MKSNKIAVIGLGAMGYGIAASLARKGWPVVGADTNPSAAACFADAFGAATGSAREAASGADVVILVVVNAAQCEAVLFGEAGALASTAPDALIISCVTMDPAQARSLGARIEAEGRAFVDAPTSGGPGSGRRRRADPADLRARGRDETGRAHLRSDRRQGLSPGRRSLAPAPPSR